MTPQEANYRGAADPNQSCGTCQHMQPNGMCDQLQIEVTPEMTCDLYMQKGETMTSTQRAGLEDRMLGGGNGQTNGY